MTAKQLDGPTQEEVRAAFARLGCEGLDACKNLRPDGGDASIYPCITCPAPKSVMIGNCKVYRSYSDYCDD